MTDNEIRSLVPGQVIRSTSNGCHTTREVAEVRYLGTCSLRTSGAYGHAYAGVAYGLGLGSMMTETILSDEYIRGTGYTTHTSPLGDGRVTGWDVVAPCHACGKDVVQALLPSGVWAPAVLCPVCYPAISAVPESI